MADGILLTNAHDNNCNVTIKAQQVNNINMWKQNTHKLHKYQYFTPSEKQVQNLHNNLKNQQQ